MKKLLFIAVVALLIDCVLWLVRAAWVAVMAELHPGPLVFVFDLVYSAVKPVERGNGVG
jgi:hypothetical protein